MRGKRIAICGANNEAVEYALGMLHYSPCVIVATNAEKPHWSRKHAFAVYVPSVTRETDRRQYRYGGKVRLGSGTSFARFLTALHDGDVYYDPGIKVEGYPAKPRTKRRSQFRIKSSRLARLYANMEAVDTCGAS